MGFDTGSWRGTETAPWRYNLIYRTSVVSPRRARASVALASVCTPAFSCTEPFTMTVTFLFRLRVHYNVFLCGALHMDGVRLHASFYPLSPHTRTLLPPLLPPAPTPPPFAQKGGDCPVDLLVLLANLALQDQVLLTMLDPTPTLPSLLPPP